MMTQRSASPSQLPPDITIDNTIGAFQIGCNIAVFLFGVVSLQVYRYHRDYREDKILLKALVSEETLWTSY
jgi:hypothetical protein